MLVDDDGLTRSAKINTNQTQFVSTIDAVSCVYLFYILFAGLYSCMSWNNICNGFVERARWEFRTTSRFVSFIRAYLNFIPTHILLYLMNLLHTPFKHVQ